MNRIEKGSLLVLAIIVAFNIFFGLGSIPLLDPDEPVYAETAREMIQFNDYLSPRIYNEYWFDKPPMYYWLVAGAMHVFGDGEFAARFPAALMAFLTVIMLYCSITRLFNERTGFWSALVLATSVQFFYLGKAAVTDTTLLFFLTGSLLCYLHKQYWLMYVCMALATVTKGPIGIVFPGAIIFLHILCTGQWQRLFKMHCLRGLLLYFFIAAPWYYLMYQVHGMEFINTFLGFHNLTRFTTPEHPTRVLWWYYFPVIILGLFPWTGLLLQSIKASITDSRSDDLEKMLFVNIWWLFVLIFFTISQTKLVSYILPMFPALAIVIGWNIARMQKENYGIRWSWIFGSGIMFLLLTAGWVIGGQQLPEVAFGGIVLGSVTFILGVSIVWALWRYRDINFSAWLHVVTGVLTMVIAFSFLLPMVANRFSVKEIVRVYHTKCDQQKPVYVDKFLRPGFMYYTGVPGEEVKPKSGDLARVLNDPGQKYVLVQGLELRRLKDKDKLQNLNEIKEIGDIYLLEKY